MSAHKSLTSTFILNKTRKDRLEAVTELNAWGQELEDLSILVKTPHLRVLALACNNIRSLKQFSVCKKLQQLLLRKNQVSDFAELYYLTRLPDLEFLSLAENPISADPSYRAKVLALLPQLTKLDDNLITPDEVADAQAAFPDGPTPNVSQDGGGLEQWEMQQQQQQTPPGQSPQRSPAGTPPRMYTPPPSYPNSSTPQSQGGYNGVTPPSGYAAAQQQPQQQQYEQPLPQGLGGLSPLQQQQFVQQQSPAPLSPGQQLQQQMDQGYAGPGNQMPQQPPPQVILPAGQQGGFDGNGLQQQQQPSLQQRFAPPQPPQYSSQGQVPQYQTTDWGGSNGQQEAAAQPSSTSDNIFYAIVALLPELSTKHLQWVQSEVEARLLELQQQQMNLNG